MFQWRIIHHMHSEEAVSECDATFNRLILQWILSPSPLCFALLSHRQYPKVAEAYLQALLSRGYGYDVIKFGTLSFCVPLLSWMMQCLSYIFLPLDSQVMSSHALSYQSIMPVNAPQVNATTTVVVSINALRIVLPPSLAGWLWPFTTEHSSFCH
jgi:hypothetical protein